MSPLMEAFTLTAYVLCYGAMALAESYKRQVACGKGLIAKAKI